MSKNCLTPRPSQVGQAPAGLLKENSLGSSSLMAWPQIGQAKRAEKIDFFARLVVHRRDQGDAVRQFQRGLEGFGQALLQIGADLEAVDHDIDRVLLLFIQLRQFVQLARACR